MCQLEKMGLRLDVFLFTIAILCGTVVSDLILSKVDRRVSVFSLSFSRVEGFYSNLDFSNAGSSYLICLIRFSYSSNWLLLLLFCFKIFLVITSMFTFEK